MHRLLSSRALSHVLVASLQRLGPFPSVEMRRDRYAKSEQNEQPVVNRQPLRSPPSSPTSTRSQMMEGKKDEIIVDIYIKQESGDSECFICLSEFKDQELFQCLQDCNHGFHFECIKKWLDISQICPLCRWSIAIEP
ncbi:RING-H2 finger protein ATL79-like [Olea europaea var. sylvestris]|uniref:RING-H2 finger protein ATL79-like n=1 Tax=Olea europaea var. sylvestris TaxID=158386 RepID=UPI000C1D73FC|nr:RING-H2 finger protein ATL79-like [Olea europaea var. sylvestris]